MKRTPTAALSAAVSALAALALAAPAGAVLQSPNVTLVTKLPEAAGAISARFSPDGKTMYVASASGLGIYDVGAPAAPKRVSRVPLPHFENEDVDVGHVAGRDIVIIAMDPSFNLNLYGALYVIDVTNPASPSILSVTPTRVARQVRESPLGEPLGLSKAASDNGHIANCVQGCRWVWTTGSDQGLTVYDFADPARPALVGSFTMPAPGKPDAKPGFTHDVFVDRAGVAWVTGEDGTFGFDTARMTDPLAPPLAYRSDENVVNTGNSGPGLTEEDSAKANASPLDFLHHNSIRTSIVADPPPVAGTTAASGTPPKGAAEPRTTLGGLGDVIAVTEEDYLRPGCNGQGSLQTWKITSDRNSDGTVKLVLLDRWTTELNELRELKGRSDPQVPATANCSAHWFDESAGMIAQGWYDQGVRFTDISNPRDIRQVGYYVTAGTFWAAYFAPGDPRREIVYALDTAGGIDVLRIDRSAATRAVRAPVSNAALDAGSRWTRPSAQWGFACSLPSAALRERAGAAGSL